VVPWQLEWVLLVVVESVVVDDTVEVERQLDEERVRPLVMELELVGWLEGGS